jgi:hypothetical protein
MCLKVNAEIGQGPAYVPLVAKTDLHVMKMLKKKNFYSWVTPFMGERIRFGLKGVHEQKGVKIKAEYCTSSVDGEGYFVDVGYHSCRYDDFNIHGRTFTLPQNYYFFDAVIPKGTKYYMGIHNDVVSERLVIFSSEKKMRKIFPQAEKFNRV